MDTYDLPYKYEVEYVHLNGDAYYNLGKYIASINSTFKVTYKADSDSSCCPGVLACTWNNSSSSYYAYNLDGRTSDSTKDDYAKMNPQLTGNRYLVGRCSHCFGLEQIYTASNPSATDSFNDMSYYFYVSTSGDEKVYSHKFIGYFTKVYLKQGETFTIYGVCDDALYIRFDGERKSFHNGYSSTLDSGWRFFSSFTYTATEDGYHDLAIIGANFDTIGVRSSSSDTRLSMTIAPAGSELTIVTSESAKPASANVGDRCRVRQTLSYGSATYEKFVEYLWTGSAWKQYTLGNSDLDEVRFYMPSPVDTTSSYPIIPQCIFGDSGTNTFLFMPGGDSSKFGDRYGTTESVVGGFDGTDISSITTSSFSGGTVLYSDGKSEAHRTISSGTFKTAPLYVGYSPKGPEVKGVVEYHRYGFTGLIGNLYSVYLSNSTDETYTYYPVVDNDDVVKLYCLETGDFVSPGLYKYNNVTWGKVTPGPITHIHDHLFPSKLLVLGKIPGETSILTDEDSSYAYKTVDTLPDPETSENVVVIPSSAQQGFGEGQVLVATPTSSGYEWKQAGTVTDGVDPVTNFTCYKSGYKVHVRWNDPSDVTDPVGTVLRKWKKTVLLRKYGSYPKSAHDGYLVIQSTNRDFYSTYDHELIDQLPMNVNGTWFYKFFTYSEDGVVSTSTDSQFSPVEFTWSKMSEYIQSGQARKMFAIGDRITFDSSPFTGSNAVWNNLSFMVAGFDQAVPSNIRKSRSITLVSEFIPLIGTNNSDAKYDLGWTSWRRVDGETVTHAGQGPYYIYTGSQYKVVEVPIGTTITEDMGYYRNISEPKRSSGHNMWSSSASRAWVNGVKNNIYKLTSDTTVTSTKAYYIKESDGSYFKVDLTTTTVTNPRSAGWYEVMDSSIVLSSILNPRLAIKRLDKFVTSDTKFQSGKTYYTMDSNLNFHEATVTPGATITGTYYESTGFYDCLMETTHDTALPSSESSSGTSEVTNDVVYLPSITEVLGTKNGDITEGTQLDYFKDESNRKRYTKDSVQWAYWFRSPSISEVSRSNYYTTSSTVAQQGVTSPAGFVLVLNIG